MFKLGAWYSIWAQCKLPWDQETGRGVQVYWSKEDGGSAASAWKNGYFVASRDVGDIYHDDEMGVGYRDCDRVPDGGFSDLNIQVHMRRAWARTPGYWILTP